MPGTPLSSWVPRSANSIPEPATRSLTVVVTSTSLGCRQGGHACANVHGDPADALFQKLDLAGVDPCADLESFLRGRDDDRLCAADRARRAVKRRQESVTGAVDLLPAVLLDVATHEAVVPLE